MSSLRPPPSPSPSPSPVQGANGKNASARASMGPAARPSAGTQQAFNLASPRPGGGPPSGRPTSELLGSATFQTPEGEFSTPFSLSLGRGEFDGRNTSRSKSINLHPRIEIDALFYTGVASLSTALRPLALLSSVLPLPSPPRMSSCTSFASTRSFFSYLFGFYIRSLILTALYSGCY